MTLYLVLDCETGGLDHRLHALLTVYFGLYDEHRLVDERTYNFRADNKYSITADALVINKINLADHNKIAQAKEDLLRDFTFFMSQCRYKPIPIGWNLLFDFGFIHEQFIPKSVWDSYISYRSIDVQVLSRFFYDHGSLERTANALAIPIDAHDARSDATATYKIYRGLVDMYKPKEKEYATS